MVWIGYRLIASGEKEGEYFNNLKKGKIMDWIITISIT
jgi:hypothetical protein